MALNEEDKKMGRDFLKSKHAKNIPADRKKLYKSAWAKESPKHKALKEKLHGKGEHSKVSFTPKSEGEARKFKKFFQK